MIFFGLILPYYKNFTISEFRFISTFFDTNIIIEKCAYRLGIDFDYTKYENFEYSEELLAKVLFPF